MFCGQVIEINKYTDENSIYARLMFDGETWEVLELDVWSGPEIPRHEALDLVFEQLEAELQLTATIMSE
jgi:hypothetical protein